MNIINRVKNIISKPKEEWLVIDSETTTPPSLFTSYLVPLGLASAAAALIGYGFIGTSVLGIKVGGTLSFGIYQAITVLVSLTISFFVATYIVDLLAPSFKSEKDLNKSGQLMAYAYTPSLVGSLLAIIPAVSWIGALFGIYGLYLWWVGLPILKKTPEQSRVGYMLVTILLLFAVYFVVGLILTSILAPVFGISEYGSLFK